MDTRMMVGHGSNCSPGPPAMPHQKSDLGPARVGGTALEQVRLKPMFSKFEWYNPKIGVQSRPFQIHWAPLHPWCEFPDKLATQYNHNILFEVLLC